MIFAEFLRKDLSGKYAPTVGDRSVFILDGRNTKETMHLDAVNFAIKHGHDAYRLMRGESFTRAVPISMTTYILK